MSKEFKTINELVELLNSRGVLTNVDTEKALERESYYAIVNGYKQPFLDYNEMSKSSDYVYLSDTEFVWIYDLFLFDRDLRNITFKSLTRAEAVLRSAVAYAFSESHPDKNDYLDRANFCKPKEYLVPKTYRGNKVALYAKNLNDLMARLNDKLTINRNTRPFVKHYIKAHGGVPLWVLSNDLTFGNIIHFYQLMKDRERKRVCSIVAKVTNRDQKDRGFLTERKLLRSANTLNHFRNICAHDERLYCAKYDGEDYGTMLVRLKDLLPSEEIEEFLREMTSLYKSYEDRLHNMNFDDLLIAMGFPRK